ncbi:hypothetical protein PI124_g21130 [Phytophthora idaei]|nr:hypothetical protein PI125_g22426 [Phytophthora idaei]KAG3133880.1 hypothetical protein PI126_g18964 [Phytophthora idaei]KAG3233803.1 hypothetical protein PI124_g21130 [Phytophthora idaei]
MSMSGLFVAVLQQLQPQQPSRKGQSLPLALTPAQLKVAMVRHLDLDQEGSDVLGRGSSGATP